MISPGKLKKYTKEKRGKYKRIAFEKLDFGSYGFQSTSCGCVTAPQLEAARRIISKHVKGIGKVWVRTFPGVPRTKKSNESRMGKGKGGVRYYIVRVVPGTILYEMEGINLIKAQELLKKVSYKLPIPLVLLSY